MNRCPWVPQNDVLYQQYHDTHWGVPCTDDAQLFEYLVLEAAQAGLTWRMVLTRRDSYRRAFYNYDLQKIAQMVEDDIQRLMQDPGIIRNRLKIVSTINNAQRVLEIQHDFGSFSKYLWAFVNFMPVQSNLKNITDYVSRSPLSDKISKDLKKRGLKFVGTTIIYAYMQAIGLVNDHTTDCYRFNEIVELGKHIVA